MSNIRRLASRLAVLPLLLLLPLAPAASAHEGHDHEAEAAAAAPPAPGAPGAPTRDVVELSSDLYEAVIESHGDHFDIWLDRWDSNEPVTGAKLEVAIDDAAGVAAVEESPGQYRADVKPLAPGSQVAITLTIQAAPGEDLLGGTLALAAPTDESLGAQLGGWLAGIWRWLLGLALLAALAVALLRRRGASRAPVAAALAVAGLPLLTALGAGGATLLALAATPAAAHEGHDHAAEEAAATAAMPAPGSGDRPARLPDGSVFVPKPTQRILELRTQAAAQGPTPLAVRLAGEIVGDPRASAVLQTLQGGRVAGNGGDWPALGAKVRRGQVLLRLTPSGSGGERASTAAEAARVGVELSQAEAELARLEGLPGVVSRAEVEAARARVASLRAQRRAFGAPNAAGGESIVAPIDGVIASIETRPGAVASPGEPLLTVIDPARLSVEALAFEPVSAAAVTRASVALRDGGTLEARLVGVGAELKGGAVPVRLDLASVAPGLAVGQPVTVFLERTVNSPGIALPVEAVVRLPNGERVVYEKVSAERFVPRSVRVRALSADRVAVLAGLEPDKRVVVRGAALISQVR